MPMESEYEDYDYDYLENDVTTPDSSEWINKNVTNATTMTPDKKLLAKELSDKLYHLKLWTIVLISCIGLILFLASLWLGRKTLSRVQRLGIMKPSRMRDIWANVQVVNFRPAVLFKKSTSDLSKKRRRGGSPIMHSFGSNGDEQPSCSESQPRSFKCPGPVFAEAPVDIKKAKTYNKRRPRSDSVRPLRFSNPAAPTNLKLDIEGAHRKRSSSESSTRRMRFTPHYDDEEEQIVYKIVAV